MEQKKNTPEEIKLPPEIIKYEAILAKDPKSVVFAPLADAYRKAGMLDDAIRVCTEGLKYHPDHTGGRVVLGRVYFEKGLFDEAQRELERAVKISPENIVA
ncbi:MAG: tetratricopeptide repeat protein [Candidatus Aenigmatarchaeota archaeon]